MKLRIFLLLIIPFVALAQTLEYEVIRTQESPGFFAVRLFAGKDLRPEHVEDVFVTNFQSQDESKTFQPLIQKLKKSGFKVVEKEAVRPYLFNENFRVIVLGGLPVEGLLHFSPSQEEDIEENFTTFSETYLGPVYLKNISANFGGNVTDVFPKKIPYLNDKSVFFIGKFKAPIKTRMAIKAEHQGNKVETEFPLNLETYQENHLTPLLPTLWEKVQKKSENKPNAFTKNISKWTTDAFPLVLILLGSFLIYLALRSEKKYSSLENLVDETFWNTPIEETPLYKEWEKNLPFKIKDETITPPKL